MRGQVRGLARTPSRRQRLNGGLTEEHWQACILCRQNYRTAGADELCPTCLEGGTVFVLTQRVVARWVDALVYLAGHKRDSVEGVIQFGLPCPMPAVTMTDDENLFCAWPLKLTKGGDDEAAPEGIDIAGSGSVMVDGKRVGARKAKDPMVREPNTVRERPRHSGRTTTKAREWTLDVQQ